jgi:hypothetical protein
MHFCGHTPSIEIMRLEPGPHEIPRCDAIDVEMAQLLSRPTAKDTSGRASSRSNGPTLKSRRIFKKFLVSRRSAANTISLRQYSRCLWY